MIPKSLSATSLQVAELCMARWKAEQLERGKGMGGFAANLGSSVHGALEEFVKHTKVNGNESDYSLDVLLMFYRKSYMDTFTTSDASGDMYDDGVEMLKRWFARQRWEGVEVLSVEIKESFAVKTSAGDIPFNYIWDRHDLIGPNEYKIVDYKSNRWGLRPEDLKRKIQARCYGLAAQIKYPDATRIWVEFDMLRHDPVGIVYTRDENIATWKFIRELSERIISTHPDDAKETLNNECRFCVRKAKCEALARNIAVGGIFSITTAEEAVDRRAVLDFQIKAINSAILELDEVILAEAREKDVLEFESEMNRLEIGMGARRSVDAERVEAAVGTDLLKRYGGVTITLAGFEKLMKDPSLDDQKRRELKGLIYKKAGEPKVKVVPKNGLDGD